MIHFRASDTLPAGVLAALVQRKGDSVVLARSDLGDRLTDTISMLVGAMSSGHSKTPVALPTGDAGGDGRLAEIVQLGQPESRSAG